MHTVKCFNLCYLIQIIQFNINHLIAHSSMVSSWRLNRSIWSIDGILTGPTTLGQSGPGSIVNEEILPKFDDDWCLIIGWFRIISRTPVTGGVLLLCTDAVGVFWRHLTDNCIENRVWSEERTSISRNIPIDWGGGRKNSPLGYGEEMLKNISLDRGGRWKNIPLGCGVCMHMNAKCKWTSRIIISMCISF